MSWSSIVFKGMKSRDTLIFPLSIEYRKVAFMFNSQVTRRNCLAGLILGLTVTQMPLGSLYAQETESVRINWSVPSEQLNDVREDLNFSGQVIPDETSREDDRGLPLIYILIGAVTLGQLAQTLLEVYKDSRYSGVVVRKNKKGELVIKNEPNLERGTIVVEQGSEIKVIFKEKDDPKAGELINALTSLVKQ
jgi:hypothetical protein